MNIFLKTGNIFNCMKLTVKQGCHAPQRSGPIKILERRWWVYSFLAFECLFLFNQHLCFYNQHFLLWCEFLSLNNSLQVFPSLNVSFAIRMCSSRLKEYIVRMDILNRTPSESFILHQLSCNDSKWAISSLPLCDSIRSIETVSANQSVSCFFKIKVILVAYHVFQIYIFFFLPITL